jgi:hypothetical protein
MTFVTEYGKKIKEQSTTFEDRLCEAIENDKNLFDLMIEAREIFRVGYFTPKEYKTLTNIELYREILA